MIGGFTALFGGLVMLTQPAVKTSLAWSTVAQMGFMIMQCGLALFPLALLHIVAHSLYKAHAFLASGTAVETVAAIRGPARWRSPNGAAVGKAFLAALAIYAADRLRPSASTGKVAAGHRPWRHPDLRRRLSAGAGLADAAPRTLTRRTALYALGAALGYFTLQTRRRADGGHPAARRRRPGRWNGR
jgi:NAD(P)H-quinone oxidoreductase subunit 5